MLVPYASSIFSIKHEVFPRSIVFLDSRRIVVRYICIHKSFFHYFRCFTCILLLHCVCFSRVVGAVVCSGLLVGCTSFARVPAHPVHFSTTRFFVLSRHDHTVLLTGASFLPLLFVSPPLYRFHPSPCEGLRILSPRIYFIHLPTHYSTVKFAPSHRLHSFFLLDTIMNVHSIAYYSVAIRVSSDKQLPRFPCTF